MKSQELREKFIQFFQERGHTTVSSSPVIPYDDPTLLFVNAGMNQFKDIFLGRTKCDYTRAVSSQKCVRVGGKHNDLDNVGHTTRHLTLFEMLGNFSFGDYFKKEAIAFAWEFSTEVMQLDRSKLWVSIYANDDESFEYWKQHIAPERIVRIATKDNFWEMGDTGPCGPCSELFYDKGEKYGSAQNPAEDSKSGERFFEFWNLVFMQYNRDKSGKITSLPKPCVDTGMGFERMLSLLQGVESVFHTDIMQNLIRPIERLSGISYKTHPPSFHVIADHLRSLSFAIADGAVPSNVDRGYVLRKLLRRAMRYGRKLGLNEPFLGKLLPALIDEMGKDFPELITAQEKIAEIFYIEEENFLRTLRRGGNILNTIIANAEESVRKEISGEDAFKLKDTYGFPLEEILLLAKDSSLQVNLESYQLLEEKARERSKKSHKKHDQETSESLFSQFAQKHPPSQFFGYEHLELNGTITGFIKDGEFCDSLSAGDEGWIILDQTPFYAEKGGQVGDTGNINHHSAFFKVHDCQNPYPGVIIHKGQVESGMFILGEPVHAAVDKKRRAQISRHHTATHLLHWALTEILGPHVKQAGSYVSPDGLRFDFAHHKGVTREEIRAIEQLISAAVCENHPVRTFEMAYSQIKKQSGIKQFFGDKYGDVVRIVDIDEFAKELCGGTHISSLADIGPFRITKESSIAAGVRRIEAVTGKLAEDFIYEREDILYSLCDKLGTSPAQVENQIDSLINDAKHLRSELKEMRKAHVYSLVEKLASHAQSVGDITFIGETVDLMKEEFTLLANDLFNRLGHCVIALGSVKDGKASLLVRVSPQLVRKGICANDLIKASAKEIDGSGGGKPEQAQAGGKNPDGLKQAYATIRSLIS